MTFMSNFSDDIPVLFEDMGIMKRPVFWSVEDTLVGIGKITDKGFEVLVTGSKSVDNANRFPRSTVIVHKALRLW